MFWTLLLSVLRNVYYLISFPHTNLVEEKEKKILEEMSDSSGLGISVEYKYQLSLEDMTCNSFTLFYFIFCL